MTIKFRKSWAYHKNYTTKLENVKDCGPFFTEIENRKTFKIYGTPTDSQQSKQYSRKRMLLVLSFFISKYTSLPQ